MTDLYDAHQDTKPAHACTETAVPVNLYSVQLSHIAQSRVVQCHVSCGGALVLQFDV